MWPLLLYSFLVLLTCLWVLSLPILPTQDGPLHLYYVNIFKQILSHQHTVYTRTYTVRHLLPPYAAYYYGLIGLSHFVSLETADKLFLCACIAFFGYSGYVLLRTVSPASRWSPFLLLPVLLNWPCFMGFLNFMLAIDFACLAIAAWCLASRRSDLHYTVAFLALIVCMVVTHPVPWLFTLGFASLELAIRLIRRRRGTLVPRHPHLGRDLTALALASLAYFYFRQFKSSTQLITRRVLARKTHGWLTFHQPTSWARLHIQAFSLLHTQGIVLFLGSGLAHLYRDGIGLILDVSLAVALWAAMPSRRSSWQLTHTWLLYALALAFSIILVPDSSAGGYYFTTRLQLLLYVCCVVAASDALTRLPRLAPCAAGFAIALYLLTLGLAVRYISPAARVVASLRNLPAVPADPRPGLLMRPVGAAFPPFLNFDAYNWAPAHYFRWHSLLLYNTAWLGDSLIPIRPQPAALPRLDGTFFNQAPEFGDRPLYDDLTARRLLNKVSFALLQRDAVKDRQHPFAEEGGSSTPGDFSQNWTCHDNPNRHWTICLPASKR